MLNADYATEVAGIDKPTNCNYTYTKYSCRKKTLSIFYDREQELADLADAWKSNDAKLMLLYGRRRVGKTCLLQHFFSDEHPCCYFLASSAAISDNIALLAETLIATHPSARGLTPADLPTLRSVLQFYADICRETRFALVLDEFQYLVQQDPSIPSQIQAWWDLNGLRTQAFVVLCGSHIGVMEGLAGSSEPLYGRFTARRKLPPMTYNNTAKFYHASKWSGRDILTAYGVLGGTPRYHALFDPDRSLGWNIIKHILSPDGPLHDEPEALISSSSVRDPAYYNSVLRAIAQGETRPTDIAQRTGLTLSQFGVYARNLMELEWMDRETPFGEDSTKRSIYRITDHFIHFYYRFVASLASDLEFRNTAGVYRTRVEPYLNDYMGRYVFEDICMQYLKNKAERFHGLLLRNAGRYWSRDGSVEIDIVGDLDDHRALACECKWSSSPVGVGIYYELMRKSRLLPPPRGNGMMRYALFSMAGFDQSLIDTATRDDVILISGDDLLDNTVCRR
ncbi:MAG: ATP-binding protein [Armatimonadota bacterium]